MNRTEQLAEQVIRENDNDLSWQKFQVLDYPDFAESGNFQIKKFEVEQFADGRKAWIIREGPDRDPGAGTFHKLVEQHPDEFDDDGLPRGETVWMADTRAEIMEHYPFLDLLAQTDYVKYKRVLINGLGLGMVAHAAAAFDGVEHVDVVDINADVVKLVAPLLPEKVTVHLADAYEIEWPVGTRWDLIWHDIWPEISDDNLPLMDKLKRKYRRKGTWQGFWQKDGCEQMRRVFAMMDNNTLPPEAAFMMLNGVAPWRLGL